MHGAIKPQPQEMTRRTLLRLAAAGIGLSASAVLFACSPSDDHPAEPDHPFRPLYESARSDRALIDSLRAQFPADSPEAITLAALSDARQQHADTLAEAMTTDGIDLATSEDTAPGAPGTSVPDTPNTEQAETTPDFAQLAQRMRLAADSASDCAATDTGYRRAVAASISACCVAAAEVLLAPYM